MFYITGDTHGQFQHIEAFCERIQPTSDHPTKFREEPFFCFMTKLSHTCHVSVTCGKYNMFVIQR